MLETCREDWYSILYFRFPVAVTELRLIPSSRVGNLDHKPRVSEENPDGVITNQECLFHNLDSGVVVDVKGLAASRIDRSSEN